MTDSAADDVIAAIRALVGVDAQDGGAPMEDSEAAARIMPLLDAYASADRRLTMARAAQFLASTPGDAAMENTFEGWLRARESGDAAEEARLSPVIAATDPLLKVRVLVGRLLHALGPWTARPANTPRDA